MNEAMVTKYSVRAIHDAVLDSSYDFFEALSNEDKLSALVVALNACNEIVRHQGELDLTSMRRAIMQRVGIDTEDSELDAAASWALTGVLGRLKLGHIRK